MVDREVNLAVFHRWIAAHRRHDVSRLADLVSDDIALVSGGDVDHPRAIGRDASMAFWRDLFTTFPDLDMEVQSIVSDGDALIAEILHSGTMEGPLNGADATGRQYRANG